MNAATTGQGTDGIGLAAVVLAGGDLAAAETGSVGEPTTTAHTESVGLLTLTERDVAGEIYRRLVRKGYRWGEPPAGR